MGSEDPPAIRVAIHLARRPEIAATLRRAPLPADVLLLLKIAAGDIATCKSAVMLTGLRSAFIREASILYIQSVLLAPGADSYRVLGAEPDAPLKVLRENMRWLMRWLHPDRNTTDWESTYSERVLSAWESVKSPTRRAVYDSSIDRNPVARDVARPQLLHLRQPRRATPEAGRAAPRFPRLSVVLLIAIISAIAVLLWSLDLAPRS